MWKWIPLICLFVSLLGGSYGSPLSASAQAIFDLSTSSSSTQSDQRERALPQRWPTLPLLKRYQGEEREGVKYLNSVERQQIKLHVIKGQLCDAAGVPLNPKHTAPHQTLTSFPDQPNRDQTRTRGFAIYVMSAEGEIFISFDAERHRLHHSSLMAGEEVAAAGEMVIYQGRLYAINNRSGHYQPPPITLSRVMRVLKARGVSLESVFTSRFGSDF